MGSFTPVPAAPPTLLLSQSHGTPKGTPLSLAHSAGERLLGSILPVPVL